MRHRPIFTLWLRDLAVPQLTAKWYTTVQALGLRSLIVSYNLVTSEIHEATREFILEAFSHTEY